MNNENYPDWLVPLEVGKKLKEIGFEEPCVFYHDENNTTSPVVVTPNFEEENLSYENRNLLSHQTSLPVWTEVFTWFRKRGLYGFITFDNTYPNSVSETFSFEIRKIDRKLIYSSEENSTDKFNCYEEAREALFLKLIDLYKTANQYENPELLNYKND